MLYTFPLIIIIIIIGLLKTPFAAQRLNCTVLIHEYYKNNKIQILQETKILQVTIKGTKQK